MSHIAIGHFHQSSFREVIKPINNSSICVNLKKYLSIKKNYISVFAFNFSMLLVYNVTKSYCLGFFWKFSK
ncbi:hypothetical protein BpHYR1_049494 [Brachionus plicatilis]|uniref:Uncharacterized protein n=1 Tax=Brachionus plicatilis TaxID=10195 RepID=A0A3M7S8N7_BRAPC|nr:hypothetical protein BpHYR1_049494 [Brachionus plicatilis]